MIKCKKKVQISDKDRLFINQFADLGTDYIYEPAGCDCCNNGYLGRMPVFEILEIDENIISTSKIGRASCRERV